jgi:hypothetical protein
MAATAVPNSGQTIIMTDTGLNGDSIECCGTTLLGEMELGREIYNKHY